MFSIDLRTKMIKRPTFDEGEDDLLRLQEEFSKNPSAKSSVTLIKSRSEKKVSFKEEKPESIVVPVLSEIREKNLDVKDFQFRPPKSMPAPHDFIGEPSSGATIFPVSVSTKNVDETADVDTIKREVHLENVNRLSALSQEDIMKEREELMKKLDPKLIEFLKSGRKSAPERGGQSVEAKRPDSTLPNAALKPMLPLDEFPIEPSTAWLHMDQPEPEKMAWMGPMPEPAAQQEFYSARFDFNGNVVSRNADFPVSAGLHHHGEEPQAAGYTLAELLRLCRVQALNQRFLALNTLSNIVRKAKAGAYDNVLMPPSLMKSLLESNACTIMRYALDDSAESVVVAACSLLASFLHSPSDEACLDISYGLSIDTSQLSLIPEDEEQQDPIEKVVVESQMDDETHCNKDTILGLLLMGTLDRFRYIMEEMQPKSGRCVMDIFCCLIRIAHHSPRACSEIIKCPRLMTVIRTQFLPSAWQTRGPRQTFYPDYKSPYWTAVKLCRIMASWKREIAVALVEKYNVEDAMMRYIITEPEDMMIPLPEASQLIVESYRLWSQLLMYDLCDECFSDIFETIMHHLRAAVSVQPSSNRRQFHWDRAAAVALMVEKFVKRSNKEDLRLPQLSGIIDVILMALMKFLSDGKVDADISYYYLVASLANCASESVNAGCLHPDQSQKDLIVGKLLPQFQASFGDQFSEDSVQPPPASVRRCQRDPPSLPSLESAGGETLVAIVGQGSLYPLFMSLRRLHRAFDNVQDA